MKRLLSLSLAVLLFGCGDTATGPGVDVEPQFAAGGGKGVDAVSTRLVSCGFEIVGECGSFSVHARGVWADASGRVTFAPPDGPVQRFHVVGLNVDTGLGQYSYATIKTAEGVVFGLRHWEDGLGKESDVFAWIDQREIPELVPSQFGHTAVSGHLGLRDGVTQEAVPVYGFSWPGGISLP